jgi:cytoskeletal protein CcmA (bactofilin family)
MFAPKKMNTTVIAEGLKIVGSVTADGLVEVNGHVDGELHCTTLVVSRKAIIAGTIAAEHVVVDGKVEGPILGGDVVLKSQAHVVGDIACESVTIEKGAFIEGRLVRSRGGNGRLAVSEPMHETEAALLVDTEQTKRKAVVDSRRSSGKSEFAH